VNVTALSLAERFVGTKERAGEKDHPLIQWWLSLCGFGFDAHDEVPWCSAFVNGIAWELRLPRSKSAAARSWLDVGTPVTDLALARPGWDVVVFKRGSGAGSAGPEVRQAPGHVALLAGVVGDQVLVCGGNQSNEVTFQKFPIAQVLGVRRLYTEAA
jgi:uncharacterized protein (TIGR02594 family)